MVFKRRDGLRRRVFGRGRGKQDMGLVGVMKFWAIVLGEENFE